MTHQDPTAPADSTAMASQLAQFSSLEQLTNINTTLQGQGTSTTQSHERGEQLGRAEPHRQDRHGRQQPDRRRDRRDHERQHDRPRHRRRPRPDDHRLEREQGRRRRTSGRSQPGTQSVQLAGLTGGLASGVYNVQFTLTDASGNVTNPASMITAKVDGVTFSGGGAEATSGPLTIPIGSIASVTSN